MSSISVRTFLIAGAWLIYKSENGRTIELQSDGYWFRLMIPIEGRNYRTGGGMVLWKIRKTGLATDEARPKVKMPWKITLAAYHAAERECLTGDFD